jgi:hypothetical protein
MKAPWAESAVERNAIEAELRDLIGVSICGWRTVDTATNVAEVQRYQGFLLADFAVVVDHADGSTIKFAWQMEGVLDGLSVSRPSASELHDWLGIPGRSLSPRISEPALPAQIVTSARALWAASESVVTTSLRAVTLEFEFGPPITIALGAVIDGRSLTFQPDSVALIHDPRLAAKYREVDPVGSE